MGCLDSSLRWNDEVEIERNTNKQRSSFAWFVFDLNSPCCRACDDLKSWEILSEDCLSPKFLLGEFRSAQLFEAAQEISGMGCLFVWVLYFGQAK